MAPSVSSDLRLGSGIHHWLCAALLVPAVLTGCGASPGLTSGAALEFSQPDYDFGRVLPGSRLETDFVFHNRGARPVTIQNVRTSCGCTAAKPDRSVVLSGDSGKIHVSFQVALNSDPVRHQITVETDSPAQGTIDLFVQADPDWPISAQPESIHVVPIPAESGAERELELYTTSGDSFQIQSIEASVPWITVTPLSHDGRRQRFLVRMTPTTVGAIDGRIRFHTDIAGRETLVVPVTGQVVSGAQLVPSRLLLGNVESGSTVTAHFVLTMPAQVGISRLAFRDSEWVLVDQQITIESTRARVALTLRLPQGEGYRSSVLLITCSDGAVTELPVSGLLATAGPVSAVAPENRPTSE